MRKLMFGALMSLDGFIADERGDFAWAAPDEEVHSFINDLERPIGTHLYGRKLYETMIYWQTAEPPEESAANDYATIWRSTKKIVYSSTLERVTTENTHLERAFVPEDVARLKATADRDVTIGGPHLAAQAFAAGLVDECWFCIAPIVVGTGNRAFSEGLRVKLELFDTRRFAGGFTFVRYRVKRPPKA